MQQNNQNPLVSVIVRTKDRPKLLLNAIRSIQQQTYRPIEVVLVNDGGCDLDTDDIKSILGDVTLSYIRLEKNTGRAHAGNVGIENAKGEYIGFLDDDDELYPEHVEVLVEPLIHSEYKVAYTSVEFMSYAFDKDLKGYKKEKKWVFGKQFSLDDLIICNYIPIMALLFKSHLFNKLKFDESFNLYEDWDILIRIAIGNKFFFVNKITAVYNNRGGDQVAFNSAHETVKQSTIKLYEKHRAIMPMEKIFELREQNSKKDTTIFEQNSYIEILKDSNMKLEREIAKNASLIKNIQASWHWNFLRRYPKIREIINS